MNQPLRPELNEKSTPVHRPAFGRNKNRRPVVVPKPRNDLPIGSSAHFPDLQSSLSTSTSYLRKLPIGYWLTGVAVVAFAMVARNYQVRHLQNEAFATGYILMTLCIGLTLLGVRKRMVGAFPTGVLGTVRQWQRAHHWLGSLCLICYLLHAGVATRGWLDSALAILFWTVSLSGLISWYINKTSPRLLLAAGHSVLLSDIPLNKKMVREDAYRLALKCAGDASWSVIADLYRTRLADYFQLDRGLWYRINPNGKKRRFLLQELELLDRFLDERGRELKFEMSTLVKRRDDLDFQMAIKNRIKFWSAFHQCWLGAFVVLAIAHVALAHLYSSHW